MSARSILLLALLPVMPVAANNPAPLESRLLPRTTVMKATSVEAVEMPDSRMMASVQPTGWIGNVADRKPAGKTLGVLAMLAALVLLVGAVVFLRKKPGNAGPCYFPEPSWQPRLGAPHAGGNQAVRDLGPPLP